MDAAGLEPRDLGELAQDEERARTREPAAARSGRARPVADVEYGRPRERSAQRFDGLATDRHDALLRALADAADDRCSESTPFRSSPTASLTRRPAP